MIIIVCLKSGVKHAAKGLEGYFAKCMNKLLFNWILQLCFLLCKQTVVTRVDQEGASTAPPRSLMAFLPPDYISYSPLSLPPNCRHQKSKTEVHCKVVVILSFNSNMILPDA